MTKTTDAIEAVVFGDAEPWLAARTLRALERLGVEAKTSPSASAPTWYVRAGAVPVETPRLPRPSATGRPVAFLGATQGDVAWGRLLATTGGALPSAFDARIDSVLLEPGAAVFTGNLPNDTRAVRFPPLDVALDARLAVVEIVANLHRGGAQRVVLDLTRELRASGHDVALTVLDRAKGTTFAAPENTLHATELAAGRATRLHLLADMAISNGADLIHAHLLDGDEIRLLARAGLPVVVTVHHSKQGWPANLAESLDHAALVVACSLDVADELFSTKAPVRTIWNGIAPRDPLPFEPQKKKTLVTIANHLPQKRLDRIPPIVAALGEARAVIVGEAVGDNTVGAEVLEQALRLEVEVALVGSKPDMGPTLAAADVVLATSDYEGLSLAHLEAMAAEVPLVTTAVSGTREIAAKHTGVSIVKEPTTESFVKAILAAEQAPAGLAPDFTSSKMAERHADMFRRVARLKSAKRRGVVLVTNQFLVGGSQSSARRLLEALAGIGVSVRAATVDERRDRPSAGCVALVRAGIDVYAAARGVDALGAARDISAFIDRQEPEAVLLWDLPAEHKLAIADLSIGRAIWDVSAGERWYHELAAYFEKPRVGMPYLRGRDYGRLLRGAVVSYEGEKRRMDDVLGVRVDVIPPGVFVPARPTRRKSEATVVIGALARVTPEKKLEQLVDAAKKLTNVEVRICGPILDQRYADTLHRLAGGDVTFVPEKKDAAVFLSEIDVFASISEPGGISNALLEAMAAGLPVVATDHGGVRDQILHGETGIIVARGDSQGLANALGELASDRERRERLGDRAHERAKERFDIQRTAKAYERLCLGAP